MRLCAFMIAAGRGAIPHFTGKSEEGLPALRREWILKRGDVEEHDGREVKPKDNGYLSGKHAEFASKAEKNRLVEFPGLSGQRRRPLRASKGHPVTQLWYAKQGIITPEMEFIAIRENMKIADCEVRIAELSGDNKRNDLDKQHAGSSQIGNSAIGNRQSLHAIRFPQISATHPEGDHAGICPRRSRRRPRHHSGEHQSSRT